MPAKDIYHSQVVNALNKDGWLITDDPLRLQYGAKDFYVDLGAEKLLAAEKNGNKIAVEIKSFVGASEIEDLKNAIGQFVIYRSVMERIESERKLFLAIRDTVFIDLFEEPIGKLLIETENLKIIVFDVKKEEIVKWIK